MNVDTEIQTFQINIDSLKLIEEVLGCWTWRMRSALLTSSEYDVCQQFLLGYDPDLRPGVMR